MAVTGPSFIALQVRDVERSAAFYEQHLGLERLPAGPPGAVVFATTPIALAVREPLPGVDLDATPYPGLGTSVWLHDPEASTLHERLVAAGVEIAGGPFESPFGLTFTFVDPDGHHVTVHDRV